MKESIFYSSLRAFFVVLFGVLGLSIGLFLLLIFLGLFSVTSDPEPEINYKYAAAMQPNANGVRKSFSSDTPVILKLNINGVIGLETLNQNTIRQQLMESRERTFKDDKVKAILLHIDSPGGTVGDADGIYRAIKAYKEKYKTPVYAFVDGLCASGGMYVASVADKIYASDVSLIGSVGVITPPFLNFSQLIDKLGIQSMTLYEGKGKDNLNPLRPWHKGDEDNIKDAIVYYYNTFVDIVTSNRPNMSKEKLVKDYGANVYPAAIAKELGYIDEAGYNYGQALKMLTEHLEIKDDKYQVVEMQSTNWLAELFRSELNLFKGRITHQVILTPEMEPKLQNQFLYLYHP